MNWNDPETLKSASAILQWVAITLVFFGGCLQFTKHFVDLREKRISKAISAANEKKQSDREQELRRQLEEGEKRIRTLDLEVQIDIAANWNDGKPEPSGHYIFSGTPARMELVLDDGRAVAVDFDRADGIVLRKTDHDTVRISYRVSAVPGSAAFSLIPESIVAVRKYGVACIGLEQASLATSAFSIPCVRGEFFVNGRSAFSISAKLLNRLDMKTLNGKSPWLTLDNDSPVERQAR